MADEPEAWEPKTREDYVNVYKDALKAYDTERTEWDEAVKAQERDKPENEPDKPPKPKRRNFL